MKSKVLWTLKALDKKGNPFENNRKGKQWKRGGKKKKAFWPNKNLKSKKKTVLKPFEFFYKNNHSLDRILNK